MHAAPAHPTVDPFVGDPEEMRQLLANTLETYRPDWKLIHEALQNAIDSFIGPDGNALNIADPKIFITFDVQNDTVRIKDNGPGVPVTSYGHFVKLGKTTKGRQMQGIGVAQQPLQLRDSRKRRLKGSQGVGAKAIVFSSSEFEIETNHQNDQWNLNFQNYYQLLEQGAAFPNPIPQPPILANVGDSYTQLTYTIADYSVEDFLKEKCADYFSSINANWDAANGVYTQKTVQNPLPALDGYVVLERWFRTETYAADMSRALDPAIAPEIEIHLNVVNRGALNINGIGTWNHNNNNLNTYEIKVGYIKVEDIHAALPQAEQATYLLKNGQPMVNHQQADIKAWKKFLIDGTAMNGNIFHADFDHDDAIELLDGFNPDVAGGNPHFTPAGNPLLQRHQIALDRIHGLKMIISTSKVLDNVLKIQRDHWPLSCNGLLTKYQITQKCVGEKGYTVNCHIVLDVDEDLGYGKANPGHLREYYAYIAAIWKNIRGLCKIFVSSTVGGGGGSDFSEQDRSVDLAGIDLEVMRDLFGRIQTPRNEQDVIQAHNYYIGKHLNPEDSFDWTVVHSKTVFDGYMKKDWTAILPAQGQLGAQDGCIVEYKFEGNKLVNKDHDGEQTLNNYDLGICWERPDNFGGGWRGGYSITAKHLDSPAYQAQYIRNSKWRLCKGNRDLANNQESVFIITLKDIFEAEVGARNAAAVAAAPVAAAAPVVPPAPGAPGAGAVGPAAAPQEQVANEEE